MRFIVTFYEKVRHSPSFPSLFENLVKFLTEGSGKIVAFLRCVTVFESAGDGEISLTS